MEKKEIAKKPVKKLGEILLEQGLITSQQLELALKEQKRTGEMLGEILVNLGFITPEALSNALASQSGVEKIDLQNIAVNPEVLRLIPEEMARRLKVFPIALEGDTLHVAMANVFDIAAISEIERHTGKKVKVYSAPENEIMEAIQLHYTGEMSIEELIERSIELAARATAEDIVAEAPIVRLVDHLIIKGIEDNATDLHIEPEEKLVRTRYRVDGILFLGPSIPKILQPAITSRLKIMAGVNIAESRLPQDGRINFTFGRRKIDIRASFFPTVHGENIVLRILDKSKLVLGLEELGFSRRHLEIFKSLITKPYGMILVTGPTGSGKTTTLYSALNYLNSIEKNIMTIEDPVEYEFPVIRQSQVNPKAGFDFSAGMRAILRQDPDIILIGEIRDRETAEMAVRAALTGHLVMATLHTNDSVSAVPRLIEMGIERFLLASSLIGVIAQRLVRKLCPHCKVPYKPDPDELRRIGWHGEPNPTFYKPGGCKACRMTGYKGRTGIFEVLVISKRLAAMIAEGDIHGLKEAALQEGFVTLFEDGIDKVRRGITSIEEVFRVTFGEV